MRRPIIGLTSNFDWNTEVTAREQSYLLAGYSDGVYAAGGLPQAIPVPDEYDPGLVREILRCYDGLIFTGGRDLPPRYYNEDPHPKAVLMHERREHFELTLFRAADAVCIPIFAICLGHQLAHVARGGGLIQHVDDLPRSPTTVHYVGGDASAFHDVRIADGSRLAQILGRTSLEVNSRHHQAVDIERQGAGLKPVAFAPDGVLEASEDCDGRFLLTVQWHPEDLLGRPAHPILFTTLVEAAAERMVYRKRPAQARR